MNYPRARIVPTTLIVALIFLLLGAGYYFWQGQIPTGKNLQQQTITNSNLNPSPSHFLTEPPATQTQIKTAEATSLTDIPAPYPGLAWQTKVVNPGDYKLQVESKNLGQWLISLDRGEEWNVGKDNLMDDEAGTLIRNFSDYYQQEFSKRGWDWQVVVDGDAISPYGGFGPSGNVSGFVGLKDGQLRAVILSEMIPDKYNSNVKCPCSLRLSIFLSNIIPVDDAIRPATRK